MIIFGLILSFISICISFVFLFYKIFFWDSFELGMAPIIVGFFYVGYPSYIIGNIRGIYFCNPYSYARSLPLVVEKERINF